MNCFTASTWRWKPPSVNLDHKGHQQQRKGVGRPVRACSLPSWKLHVISGSEFTPQHVTWCKGGLEISVTRTLPILEFDLGVWASCQGIVYSINTGGEPLRVRHGLCPQRACLCSAPSITGHQMLAFDVLLYVFSVLINLELNKIKQVSYLQDLSEPLTCISCESPKAVRQAVGPWMPAWWLWKHLQILWRHSVQKVGPSPSLPGVG